MSGQLLVDLDTTINVQLLHETRVNDQWPSMSAFRSLWSAVSVEYIRQMSLEMTLLDIYITVIVEISQLWSRYGWFNFT